MGNNSFGPVIFYSGFAQDYTENASRSLPANPANTFGPAAGSFRGSAARCVILLNALALCALADDAYIRTAFTVEDGLPSNVVDAVLQTREGFLWIGTASGLVRFDGRHFTPMEFRLNAPGVSVRALAEASDGALWVGTRNGVTRIPAQALDQFGYQPSVSYHPGSGDSDSVRCLHFSRDGVLWVGTDAGLFRFQSGTFSAVIPKLSVSRIEEASSGHLLVITSQGFKELEGTRTIERRDLPARLGVLPHEVYHVVEDRAGVVWYGTEAGLAREADGSVQKMSLPGTSRPAVFRAFEDPQGAMWFSSNRGVVRLTAAGMETVATDISARSFGSDSNGDIWVGTNGKGLARFKRRTVRMLTAADGLPNGVPMTALVDSSGKLWLGSNCGGVSWFDGSRFHTYADKEGLTNSCVFSLAEDSHHDIWAGTYGGGVFRLRDGRFTRFSKPETLVNSVTNSIAPARDGSVWVAFSNGLSRIRDSQIRKYTTADGLPGNSVRSVYEDRHGGIWVSTSAGVARLTGDRFVAIGAMGDGLFGEDPSGELFVFSEAQGIFHIEDDRLTRVDGPPSVSSMLLSRQNAWFCGKGIFRAEPDALKTWENERDTPPDYTFFGRSDGMNSAQCSDGSPPMALTRGGKLWIATVQGVAVLDVPALPRPNRKPAIFMEQVTVGRKVQSPGHGLVVPPGTRHVELRFDSIELTSPEKTRLQYRLDGVDREWLDADAAGSAVYTSFPVGTHQFHVRGCDGGGIWDRIGIVYNITQQPYYYETGLFRVIAAGIALLLLFGAYRLRLRQIADRINTRLEERVAERTRLAGELHDTLLQTIQASKLVAEAALAEPDISARTRHALERLAVWLGQATREARDSLQSLRASTTVTNDLAEAFRDAGERCAAGTPMQFTMSVRGAVRRMHPVVRDDIYKIGYEALRNACSHSGGSRVELDLRYGRHLSLIVRDNGAGIAPEIAANGKPGHFGIKGMRERAARIGGKLALFSSPESGTEIELTVPGRIIFLGERFSWRTFLRKPSPD